METPDYRIDDEKEDKTEKEQSTEDELGLYDKDLAAENWGPLYGTIVATKPNQPVLALPKRGEGQSFLFWGRAQPCEPS